MCQWPFIAMPCHHHQHNCHYCHHWNCHSTCPVYRHWVYNIHAILVPIVRICNCGNDGFVFLTSVSSWQCHHNQCYHQHHPNHHPLNNPYHHHHQQTKPCCFDICVILTSLWRNLVPTYAFSNIIVIIISIIIIISIVTIIIIIVIGRRAPTRQTRRLATRGGSLAWLHCNSCHPWLLLLWKGRLDHHHHHHPDLAQGFWANWAMANWPLLNLWHNWAPEKLGTVKIGPWQIGHWQIRPLLFHIVGKMGPRAKFVAFIIEWNFWQKISEFSQNILRFNSCLLTDILNFIGLCCNLERRAVIKEI